MFMGDRRKVSTEKLTMRATAIIAPLFLLLLLIIPLAIAVKPGETIGGNITIVPLKTDYLRANTSITLHWHIYNGSGVIITNNLTCNFHIYNNSDAHVYTGVLSLDGFDYELVLPGNISNFPGVYPYGVWCNSSLWPNGFLSGNFEITHDGFGKDGGLVVAGFIILVPFLFAFLLIYWVSTLGEEHNVLKLALSLLSISSFFMSLWYCGLAVTRFTEWLEMGEALGVTSLLFGGMFFAIVSYFIIYMIRKIFLSIQDKKNDKFDY